MSQQMAHSCGAELAGAVPFHRDGLQRNAVKIVAPRLAERTLLISLDIQAEFYCNTLSIILAIPA